MSRQEQDKEDLLREATALVERVELQLEGETEPWVIGFRRDGAASLFVGAEPVFQFNRQNELRRAYAEGQLVKAERGRLVWLRRERTESQVQLVRREFTAEETSRLLGLAETVLQRLSAALAAGSFQVEGQVPADRDVVARVANWLDSLPPQLQIAASPGLKR